MEEHVTKQLLDGLSPGRVFLGEKLSLLLSQTSFMPVTNCDLGR